MMPKHYKVTEFMMKNQWNFARVVSLYNIYISNKQYFREQGPIVSCEDSQPRHVVWVSGFVDHNLSPLLRARYIVDTSNLTQPNEAIRHVTHACMYTKPYRSKMNTRFDKVKGWYQMYRCLVNVKPSITCGHHLNHNKCMGNKLLYACMYVHIYMMSFPSK